MVKHLTPEYLEQIKRPDFEKTLSELIEYKPNYWQNIIRETDSRFKVICAGRRSGKTHYVAYDTKDGIASDLVLPERHVWIVAPNYDLTQRVWNEVFTMAVSKFKMASQGGIIQKIHNTKGNFLIETVFGTIIEAKSADEPEKLVGVGLTKIIIDEAALLKEKAWNQSLRPTLIDHKGSAIFISTPKGKNWFWELWQKGQQKEELDWNSWNFTSYDNNHLDKKEIDKITKDMPEYEYNQEILAQFTETAEQIFRKFKERAIGHLEEPVRNHRYQIGIDLGRKTSYSVITVIDEMEYPYPVVHLDRFRKVDWHLQVSRIKEIWRRYPSLSLRVDATGIGDPLIEDLERSGVRIEPYMFTENSKRQLIDKLAIDIEDGRIIYPNNRDLLNELETFGREINPDTGRVKYKALGKFKDDCVMSLALASWGLINRARKVIEKEKKDYKPISDITGY